MSPDVVMEYAKLAIAKRGRFLLCSPDTCQEVASPEIPLVSAELRPDGLIALRNERADGRSCDTVVDPQWVALAFCYDRRPDDMPGQYA